MLYIFPVTVLCSLRELGQVVCNLPDKPLRIVVCRSVLRTQCICLGLCKK